MKRNLIIAGGAAMSLAFVLALTSCDKNEISASEAPVVTLETVEEGLSSVSFRITATNASEVAYVEQDDLSSVPSAKAILTAGTKVSASEAQEIVREGCTPGETYYFAAAAVSESGEYSEVATIELTASGTDCSFEFTISTTTDEAIAYIVTPSDENVSYVTAVLSAEDYSDASDDEIFSAIAGQIAADAEEAGQSLADYIETITHKGTYAGTTLGLTAETAYLLVAVGIESDGTQGSPLAKENVSTTAPRPEMTFEMSATEISSYSAHLMVSPKTNDNYVFLCQPANSYPDVNVPDPSEVGVAVRVEDQEEANLAADTYIQGVGHLLNQGMGLSQGAYDLVMDDLASDTKYYFFAFAYEPGLGRQSDCQMWVFTTLHGYTPEEFDADIQLNTIASTTIEFDVTPKEEGMYGTYWYALAVPTAEYDLEKCQDQVVQMLEDYVKQQQEGGNENYSIYDAVSSVLFNGAQEFMLISDLTPGTDYTLVLVPFANDGTPADNHVVTKEFTTMADASEGPATTVELVGYSDADEAFELGIFEGMTKPKAEDSYYIAAFKVTLDDSAVLCRYYDDAIGNNYESEDAAINDWDTYVEKSDDEYLTSLGDASWNVIPEGNYADANTAYIFLREAYYDRWDIDIIGATRHTLIVMSQNEAGVWGKSGRKFFYINSPLAEASNKPDKGQVLSDINELKSLVESLGQ